MATLEEMCRRRGKALAENYGMTNKTSKGTESMNEKMDFSEKGVKGGDRDYERKAGRMNKEEA